MKRYSWDKLALSSKAVAMYHNDREFDSKPCSGNIEYLDEVLVFLHANVHTPQVTPNAAISGA